MSTIDEMAHMGGADWDGDTPLPERPYIVPSLHGPRGEDLALNNQALQLACNKLMDLLALSQEMLLGKPVHVNSVSLSAEEVQRYRLLAISVEEQEDGLKVSRQGNGS